MIIHIAIKDKKTNAVLKAWQCTEKDLITKSHEEYVILKEEKENKK